MPAITGCCRTRSVTDDEPPTPFAFGHTYQVTGRSLLLFLLEPDGAYTTARMSTGGPHSTRDAA